MNNFNGESYKKTVLLYAAAGMSLEEANASTYGSDYKPILEKIAEYFNKEDNVWYEDLKMTVVNVYDGYWGLMILDRQTEQGIRYGIGTYNNQSPGAKHGSDYYVFNYNNRDFYITMDSLYFTYIKCKNGYVCGLTDGFNDNKKLIRFCGFKGEGAQGVEPVTIVQVGTTYLVGTKNFGNMKIENAVGAANTNSKTQLTPFYVTGTDLFAPEVYRCDGNMPDIGEFYELNGSIYVNCMYHGCEYNYDTCRLALKVC